MKQDPTTHKGTCNICGQVSYLRFKNFTGKVVLRECGLTNSFCSGNVRYLPWDGDQDERTKEETKELSDKLDAHRAYIAQHPAYPTKDTIRDTGFTTKPLRRQP